VDFGAFVDVGLKESGLVHISQMANRYIKSPYDVVAINDVVTVWVLSVDRDRHRVSLTMIKPGTERKPGERPPRQGRGRPRGRRPEGEGQAQGQGQAVAAEAQGAPPPHGEGRRPRGRHHGRGPGRRGPAPAVAGQGGAAAPGAAAGEGAPAAA